MLPSSTSAEAKPAQAAVKPAVQPSVIARNAASLTPEVREEDFFASEISARLREAGAAAPYLLASTRTLITQENILVNSVDELTEFIELKDALGSGGFATVFKGVYQASEVAVKLATTPKNTDQDRFCREAVLAQQLRHPHVVTTYFARGAKMTSEMIEEFYKVHEAELAQKAGGGKGAGAAGGGAAGGGGAGFAPRYRSMPPPAYNLVPSLPSMRSEDNMGNPRVVAPQQQGGGWAQALHTMGVLPGQILMVMVLELCESGSLSNALRNGAFTPQPGRLSPLTARRMLVRTATEVCRGMLHLHNANVIHGDLKPGNVLLSRSNKDRRGFVAKVADFGLSKLLHDDTNHVLSDHVGTVAYSSPEAINGNHSKASDVWAFGVMLWELVTLERPYSKLSLPQILAGVGLNTLRLQWPRQLWPELCAIGERCVAPDPAARPSFAQLEEELVVLEEAMREDSRRISVEQAAARTGSTASTSSAAAAATGRRAQAVAAPATPPSPFAAAAGASVIAEAHA
ncbi:hypothetical protein CHLRE_02g141806v5 [Chlamydomonas reinhardtii]|uniref:Protein kinase domain-containing protein n=1 Tax=Chlamydomonas reinhardtii TaxID=3055 RepID=A0A2K3E4B1_CHLRE|nr:uncharacterized protein CHLRE_02g141806v5 [Chlamydomonas reinhardtii]PNW87622.1 hypothetical protein CHLRE_02g141806v5 [Chlamydomonas reinhardtii]